MKLFLRRWISSVELPWFLNPGNECKLMENISAKMVMGRSTASVCMNLNMNLINDYEQRGKMWENSLRSMKSAPGEEWIESCRFHWNFLELIFFNQGNKLFCDIIIIKTLENSLPYFEWKGEKLEIFHLRLAAHSSFAWQLSEGKD